MRSSRKIIKELKRLHSAEKRKIQSRLAEFVEIFKYGKDKDVFAELAFCLLTPQSKAKSCWQAVKELASKNLLLKGKVPQIAKILQRKTRFHRNKSRYIVAAREIFRDGIKDKIKSFYNVHDLREWLVKNVKGLGYKEASHFLRNIGFGRNIAILDRHILRNLKAYGAVIRMPKAITKKVYLDIEKKTLKFAKKTGIPADQLDLLFWRKQTGEYFK